MRISKAGLEIIKRSEGLRLRAYPDPGSRDGTPWTIGYGHTRGVKKGDRITKARAEALLRQDVKWAEDEINRIPVDLTQNQFDALVSFVFNVGVGQFRRSSVYKAVKAGRHDQVPSRLNLWIKNDGKVLRGLVNRRAEEGRLYATPDDETEDNDMIAKAPQPVHGKKMRESRTAWLAGGQALGTAAMVTSYASEIKQNVTSIFDGHDVNWAWVFGGALIVSAFLAACWFFYDRHIKSERYGA